MIRDHFSYLVLSDVHLGHRKTPAPFIINNIRSFFNDFKSLPFKLDAIFIAGDLFDRSLEFWSEDVLPITELISDLVLYCIRFNIILRIEEGTPFHDWKQSRILNLITKIISQATDNHIDHDIRYVDTLSIETLKNGMTVLYVPDEWSHDNADTFKQVEQLMKDQNIASIDIGIMHGVFQYQLPNLNIPSHNEVDYLRIVDRWINIGHHHTHTHFERIVAQGSFDRLKHNEEEPKGCVLMEVYPDQTNDKWRFIPNPNAKVYKTITLKNNDLEKSYRIIEKAIINIPDKSHVKIKADKKHPIQNGLGPLKLKYPLLFFTKDRLNDSDDLNQKDIIGIDTSQLNYTPITITPDNLNTLLSDALKPYGLNDTQFKQINKHLKDVI